MILFDTRNSGMPWMNEMILLSQTDNESVEQKAKYTDDPVLEEEHHKESWGNPDILGGREW